MVKVPATLNTYLRLSGSKVDVSPEIHLQDVQKVVEEGNIIVTGEVSAVLITFHLLMCLLQVKSNC